MTSTVTVRPYLRNGKKVRGYTAFPKRSRQAKHLAKGFTTRGHAKLVTIYMDVAMVADLRRRAEANKTSVSEQVRTYIEWGLETDGL